MSKIWDFNDPTYPNYIQHTEDDTVPDYVPDETEQLLGVSYRRMAELFEDRARVGHTREEWAAMTPAQRRDWYWAGMRARKKLHQEILGRGSA